MLRGLERTAENWRLAFVELERRLQNIVRLLVLYHGILPEIPESSEDDALEISGIEGAIDSIVFSKTQPSPPVVFSSEESLRSARSASFSCLAESGELLLMMVS